jgi:hypothetical protein
MNTNEKCLNSKDCRVSRVNSNTFNLVAFINNLFSKNMLEIWSESLKNEHSTRTSEKLFNVIHFLK